MSAWALLHHWIPELTPDERALLIQHWELVLAWNARVNLTAITDERAAVVRHYADSLQGRHELVGPRVADMGSGAGFPGVPLAVLRPDLSVTLVEPRQKRASFLQVVVARLGLSNVTVQVGRVEQPPDRPFDTVVTRATFSAAEALRLCEQWLAPGGRLVAWRQGEPLLPNARRVDYVVDDWRGALEVWERPGQ